MGAARGAADIRGAIARCPSLSADSDRPMRETDIVVGAAPAEVGARQRVVAGRRAEAEVWEVERVESKSKHRPKYLRRN